MVDVGKWDLKYLTAKIVKQEDLFINLYIGECLKYENGISLMQRMRKILYLK